MTVRHSTCALDCPDACSVLVTIDGSGKAVKLRGNPDHPVTRGFLCGKVARYLDREYHTDRLLYPLRRTGRKGEGGFERITWDEALDAIAAKLTNIANEHGSESILPYSYAGTMGYLQGSSMDRRFFHRLGASRLDRTICSGAGIAGMVLAIGSRYCVEPEQVKHAKLIIAWGANILATNVHLWPFIVEARRNGARFYTIDPVRTKTATLADKHFFINPGSDLALILSMMHVILEEKLEDRDYIERYTTGIEALRAKVREYPPERAAALTGIPAQEIASLAREYASTRPSLIRPNYGLQRSERGGIASAAVSMLPALTGAWRDVGGGMLYSTSGAFHLDRAALERPDLQNASLGRPGRLVNMSNVGRALTDLADPPVKAFVVHSSNPAAVVPDQDRVLRGLAREDLFTVVLEQFQTDTANYADFVLPATTFLEHDDLYFAYGHHHLQLARKAVEPPGECRPNTEVFRALAQRMGFTEPCFADSADDMMRQALASGHAFLDGITLERLDAEHSVRLNMSPAGTPFLPHAEGFPALGGKMDFHAGKLDYQPPAESRLGDGTLRASYPLELVTPKHSEGMNSTFGNREIADRETATAYINSADAAPRGITNGDLVRVFNARGSLRLRAEVNGMVHAGVVSVPACRWPKSSPDQRNVNVLISDRLTDIGGSPAFYNCLVQVERCGD